MTDLPPQQIHLPQPNPWAGILPHSPLLSSASADWQGIHVEYHRQPAHDTPDYCLPSHLLSIGLGYRAKEFRANGKLYKNFVAGNIGICPADDGLRTQAYGDAEFLLVALDRTFLERANGDAANGRSIELKPQIFGQDPLVYHMSLALKQQLEFNLADSRTYAEAIAVALAAHLYQHYSTRDLPPLLPAKGLPLRILCQIEEYVRDRLDREIGIRELSALAHLSPHYFSSAFKRSTGLSPHQYIVTARIDRAKLLLSDRRLSIVEICHRVGFQSQSHFTRVFRQYTGVTPKVYRQSI